MTDKMISQQKIIPQINSKTKQEIEQCRQSEY